MWREEDGCGGRIVDSHGVKVGRSLRGDERTERKPADEGDLFEASPLEQEEGATDSGEEGFCCSTELLRSVRPEAYVYGVEVREEGGPVGGGEAVEEGGGDGEAVEADGR